MKILHEKPPIYDAIIQAGMRPGKGTVYTYADAIYNPSGYPIPPDLMAHEETHSKQQGSDPDAWWDQYLFDQYFRIEQEIEAYANQYRFICKKVKDRNKRNLILLSCAEALSGPMYGDVISKSAARLMIKNKANVK